MRVLGVAALAIALAVLAVLGGVSVGSGARPSGADVAGFGTLIAVAGAGIVAAVHWPVLAGLRRRGVMLSPARAAVLVGLGVNAPLYATLAVIGRDRSLFGADEAALFALGFALIGLVFGAGYATIHRRSAAGG